jgi:Domain of unknown function (DUF222)/HNH endonuclease
MRRRPPCRNFGGDERSRQLAARIVQRARELSALLREQLADIAEFDEAEAWRGDGCTSMVAWVTGQCRVSASTARLWVRSAANLASLPCLAEGLAAGDLSLDLVDPLAEVATSATDASLREASAHWSVRQARELAIWNRAQEEMRGGAEGQVTPNDEDDAGGGPADVVDGLAAREFERRTLRFNDTRRTVWVAFTKDDYAAAKSALVGRAAADKRESEQGRKAAGAGGGVAELGYVSYDQRLYDTLMCLFRVDFGVAASGAEGPNVGRSLRPRVIVHAPLEFLLGCAGGVQDSGPGVPEIAGVGPVAAEVARRLACDAQVMLSVESREGCILDQGRARRDPTVAQRIEMQRRDKGCRFPGCTFTEFTTPHHIRHWTMGGETNLDNLVTLCDRHHKAVHELGWTVRGNPDDVLSFTSPHGREMKSVPSPTWRRRSSMDRVPRDGPTPLRR